MQDHYVGRIEPGMDMCDIAGDKIGTIAHVHRHALEPATTGRDPSGTVMAADRDEILEAKTGPLGLGKHLYVPFSAIHDLTSECVFLKWPKEEVEQRGWDRRPDYLDERT
jgi:hypothetical protein